LGCASRGAKHPNGDLHGCAISHRRRERLNQLSLSRDMRSQLNHAPQGSVPSTIDTDIRELTAEELDIVTGGISLKI
jgi:hypothetical protein